MSDDHVVKMFTCLMLHGRFQEAIHFYPSPGVTTHDFILCSKIPFSLMLTSLSCHFRETGDPEGTNTYQWQFFGAHSSCLKEAITNLARSVPC